MIVKSLVDKFHFNSDSIFQNLPKKDLAFIESKMVERKYKKGQQIFVEGSLPSGIYFVKKGKIKKYKANHNGREQILCICSNGELLGYQALLSEENYPNSATAIEDSIIAFISKNDFLKILSQSPLLHAKILKNVSHEFGVLVNIITTLTYHTVRERLAICLLVLKEKKTQTNTPYEINLSRKDLSNMAGTAVETLVRLLRDFKREGFIEIKGRKIIILKAEKLAHVANFY